MSAADWNGYEVIAQGANRICVADPADPGICLKFEIETQWRAREGLWRRLMRNLDQALGRTPNRIEMQAWERAVRNHGPSVAELVSPCLGFRTTPQGSALMTRCIRDDNGQVARSVHQHLTSGSDLEPEALMQALDRFEARLLATGLPLFDLNAGNLVVVPDAVDGLRLWCIDVKSAVTNKELIPVSSWWPSLARRKVERRMARLREQVAQRLTSGRV